MCLKSKAAALAIPISLAAVLSGGNAAKAETYTDSLGVNPASLVCGYYASTEICNTFTPFANGPRVLNAGDHLEEDVVFANGNAFAPVAVPGSKGSSFLYVSLADAKAVNGPALPGPNAAFVNSLLTNYSGPPNPLTQYTNSYLNQYIAAVGFVAANAGFSTEGQTAFFLTGDPTPIYGTAVGFAVDLGATPTTLSDFGGGTVGSPVILPSGLVGAISSNISGGVSDSQFYDFHWAGGLFQTTGTIVGANDLADFRFQLFGVNGASPVEGVSTPVDDLLLSSENNFNTTMTLADLPAGDYEIGLYTDSPFDPEFTLTFDTPIGSVPEPGLWAMMLFGFGGIGAALRRRRAGSRFADRRIRRFLGPAPQDQPGHRDREEGQGRSTREDRRQCRRTPLRDLGGLPFGGGVA